MVMTVKALIILPLTRTSSRDDAHEQIGLQLLADQRVFASLAVVEESVRDEWSRWKYPHILHAT
jgi:hypothetical protein